MATTTITYAQLVGMNQASLQQYQAQQMGAIQGGLFNQLGMQQQNPYMGMTTTTSTAGTYSPAADKMEYPEDKTIHAHLQRRVNKWLKGVELPLHG